jgi:erythromycin esterase
MGTALRRLSGMVVACSSMIVSGCTPGVAAAGPQPPAPERVDESPDLQALGAAIGSARVVGLGEPNHLGAETVEAKLRLLRYLHDKHGFNHVILEAGLFSCAEAQRELEAGATVQQAARLCLFGANPCQSGAFRLLQYIQEVRGAGGTLHLSGMDPQLSGKAGRERLISRLREQLGAGLRSEHELSIARFFDHKSTRTAEQRFVERTHLFEVSGLVQSRLGVDSFYSRVIDGLLYLDEDHWDYQQRQQISREMINQRDRQMGQNALWLIAQHPNDRFVVWAATSHLLRTGNGLSHPGTPFQLAPGWVPTGQWLADGLGSAYFALGISPMGGSVGAIGQERIQIGALAPGMVEYGALSPGEEEGFTTRDELRSGGIRGSHLEGVSGTAPWAELLDGVWVIREDRPLRAYADCATPRSMGEQLR